MSTTGNDGNAGTQAAPWLTIQHADSAARQAGDCINVLPGTYQTNVLITHGGNAPTPTGYVTYRCTTLDACHVLAAGGGHLIGIRQPANFVVIDGFELDGNNALQTDGIADACVGSDGDSYGIGQSSHHLWVLNNIIHHCGLAGVSLNNKEWYYVIHNTVYHNAWSSGYQGSGIGLVVVQCIEALNSACASGSTYAGGTGTYVASGMDLTYATPYHNVVSGNDVYDNRIASYNPVGCGNHTDGNGIIMDTFLDETTLTLVYPYRTYVAGNTSHGNGGRGVHVFRSSNVTVANNTTYGNNTDTCINAYYLGDLSQQGGSNNVWVNNIAHTVQSPNNAACGQYCGGRNAPLVAGNGAGIVDSNNSYSNNVFFGGVGVKLFDGEVTMVSCAQNKCGIDPEFVDPGSGNFAIRSGSPASGPGTPTDGPSSPPNLGACPREARACP